MARSMDALIARLALAVAPEGPGLTVLAMHGMLASPSEGRELPILPQQAMTVGDLRAILREFQRAGYRFLSEAELVHDPPPAPGRNAFLTFDDGYRSTLYALPVLEELRVPALLCVTTRPSLEGRCYWWDVAWREIVRRGTAAEANARVATLKRLPPTEIVPTLEREFGADAFQPRGEEDRPLTPQELRALASSPWMSIGNHTHDHAILTLCSPAETDRQLATAQSLLAEWTGRAPRSFAYPNGNVSPRAVAAVRSAGIRLAFTLRARKNRWPLAGADAASLELGRFLIWGGGDAATEARAIRTPVSLHRIYDTHLRRRPRDAYAGPE